MPEDQYFSPDASLLNYLLDWQESSGEFGNKSL